MSKLSVSNIYGFFFRSVLYVKPFKLWLKFKYLDELEKQLEGADLCQAAHFPTDRQTDSQSERQIDRQTPNLLGRS